MAPGKNAKTGSITSEKPSSPIVRVPKTRKKKKYLIVSDLHEAYEQANAIGKIARSQKFDAVINLGDYIADWHTEEPELQKRVEKQLKPLDGQKVLTVPGNHDNADTLKAALKNYEKMYSLHDRAHAGPDRIGYAGFGGSEKGEKDNSDPRRAHYAPEEFDKSLTKSLDYLYKSKNVKPKDTILMLHNPALGILDASKNRYTGEIIEIGSPTIKRIVNEYTPGIVLTGHCHWDYGAVLRVRKKKNKNDDGARKDRRYASVRLDNLESGKHKVSGVNIKTGNLWGKRTNVYTISYNPEKQAVSTFINPGSLGTVNSYAVLDIEDSGPNNRKIKIEISKL